MNPLKIYVSEKNCPKYTSKCIYPCSKIFKKCHQEENIDSLHEFTPFRDQILSLQQTILKLISCGEYNKTKKKRCICIVLEGQ